MSDHLDSCTVASLRECNRATGGTPRATGHATDTQPQGLKALASKVLARNQPRNPDATRSENPCNFSAQKEAHELRQFRGEDEAQRVAGDEWSRLDNREREVLVRAVEARRMRERGEVPAHYTAKTVCAHCGEVPIFEGAPKRVLGCPWCFSRRARHGG